MEDIFLLLKIDTYTKFYFSDTMIHKVPLVTSSIIELVNSNQRQNFTEILGVFVKLR